MNTIATNVSDPSENWDDDFEFSAGGSSSTNRSRSHAHQHRQNTNDTPNTATDEAIPRISASSSNFTEDWDVDSNPRRSTTLSHPLEDVFSPPITQTHTQTQAQLREWAEPGPSTPRKPHPQSHQHQAEDVEENWDDDFEDKGDSPAKRSTRRPTNHSNSNTPRPQRRKMTPKGQETESWDDEFAADTEGITDSSASPKRSRSDAYLDSSDEEDMRVELGYAKEDEDHTVTARSRARRAKPKMGSPPPPVPALPTFIPTTSAPDLGLTAPFPRSPTASVFSVPHSTSTHNTAGRNSVATYTSTSHILGPGGKLTGLPPSPPIHRERRRLRKKSRPPGLYENVYELVEPSHTPSPHPLPSPPRTPEPMDDSPIIGSPKSASGMLSRIGSVKKWSVGVGQRRKRGSTTPSEINRDREDRENEGRPQSSASVSSIPPPASINPVNPSPSSKNWFFRGSGDSIPSSQEVRPREKSLDRLRSYGDLQMNGPEGAKLTKKRRSRVFEALGRGVDNSETPPPPAASGQPQEELTTRDKGDREAKPSLLSAIRRPSSMATRLSSTATAVGHRHVSDGTGSIGRSASNTLVSPSVEELPLSSRLGDTGKEEGGRRFGVRKLSLVKRHLRNQSGGRGVEEAIGAEVFSVPSPVEELLPPIELQPPSPPQTTRTASSESTREKGLGPGPKPLVMSLSSPEPDHLTTPHTTANGQDYQKRTPPNAINPRSPLKTPGSPQSASLGRSTGPVGQVVAAAVKDVPRRNSLGDLKIPARISQAQVSLRRDLGMVREFAGSVEQLKELQTTYYTLVAAVQAAIDTLHSAASSDQARERATPSPTPFFHLPRPTSRARSNTNPTPPSSNQERHRQLATTLYTINSKYRISWECAELLIELGGGSTASSTSPASNTDANVQRPHPASANSDPAVQRNVSSSSHKSRERAITLAGDEGKPPVLNPPTADANLAWRASTGRHDLSQRQLVILREMLNNPDGTLRIPEDAVVNRAWHWGDAMSSTITLPSEDSTSVQGSGHGSCASPTKKRRGGKMGMSGLREMLKALKKSNNPPPPLPIPTSSVESSIHSQDHHYFPHSQITPMPTQQRRRAKTSTGPESIRSGRNQNLPPTSPYAEPVLTHKSSPRRPSLASIFRIGQKSKVSLVNPDSSLDSVSASSSKQSDKSSTTEEEDWDRMDSASDLEHAATALGDGLSTVKGKKGLSPYLQAMPPPPMPSGRPVTPRMGPAASRSSIFGGPEPSPPSRLTRLSNVEENADDPRGSRALRKGKNRSSLPAQSPSRPRSRRGLKTDSVRSAPPQSVADPHSISEFKLAMTPENIKPLLENAREVQARLNECIAELRLLLAEKP